MAISTRGTLLENRRFLWTVSISFAVAAVVLPLVILAAYGHFSSPPNQQTPKRNVNPGVHGGLSHSEVVFPTQSPTPIAPRPTVNAFINPTDFGIITTTPAPNSPGVVADAEALFPLPSSSESPSVTESSMPSLLPSMLPSRYPTGLPSLFPSQNPTGFPSFFSSESPTAEPSPAPSPRPTAKPTMTPTSSPTEPPILITYRPGFLTVNENGLLLSTGLQARIIARTGRFVAYSNGEQSSVRFHTRPDFGATFPDPNPFNRGGWIYTSNSEAKNTGAGGVGAITFNKYGDVLKYQMVQKGTTMNCGGGRSPWNTWISCEEWGTRGQVYQVDPTGRRSAEKTVLGGSGGRFESFAFDVRNRNAPRFFVTEDHARGALRRFTPTLVNWTDPWNMLHGAGTMEYLVLQPLSLQQGRGTYKWVTSLSEARDNAANYYPDSEGIDVSGNRLFFVCKKIKQLFTLNLDDFTYTNETSKSGLFDGGPDQMSRIISNSSDILYFTEEGGRDAGIHGRNEDGNFYTILESPTYIDETTGLAFDPSGKHMYLAYQENGLLFDVTRRDGLPFYGTTLNVKYHNQG
jgi:hypothetical protein